MTPPRGSAPYNSDEYRTEPTMTYRAPRSTTARAMGHGVVFPNPLTGERGIWYLSGKGTTLIDPDGNATSSSLSGRLVDLCPQLGGD